MTIARFSGSLTRPWDLAKSELDAVLGETQQDGETCTWSVGFLLYTLTAVANRSTGKIEISVSTELPYNALAVACLLFSIGVAGVGAPTFGIIVAISGCLIVAGIAVLPGLYHFQWLHRQTSEIYTSDTGWITPSVCLPVFGYLVSMWAITASKIFMSLALLMTLFLLGITLYAVGWIPKSLRQQLTALAFAFFSGLPLLVTVGNLGLVNNAAQLVTPQQLSILVWVLVIHTGVIVVVYAYLSLVFVRNIDSVPNSPISSFIARIVWFGYFLILNLASVSMIVGWFTNKWWFSSLEIPLGKIISGHQLLGISFARPVAIVAVLLLMLPLFYIVGLWAIHLYQRVGQTITILKNTTRDATIDAAVPVHVVDTERPMAYVTQLVPGRSVIVVSSGLKKSLSAEEFNSVIAHEEYHIRNQDPLRNTLATLFGIAVGGRNALIASYDYPQIERAADQYAAEKCGPIPVISALRSFERLETNSTPHAQFAATSNHSKVLELLSAPYQVLFGSVVIANAHATVDERIEYLSQSMNNV